MSRVIAATPPLSPPPRGGPSPEEVILLGSISACLVLLASHGVSSASIQELQRGLSNGNFSSVLQRAQEYAECVIALSIPKPEQESIRFLLTACWTALYHSLQLQYKQAYKNFHALRHCCAQQQQQQQQRHRHRDVVESALSKQVELAERCTACLKEVILAQRRQHQIH